MTLLKGHSTQRTQRQTLQEGAVPSPRLAGRREFRSRDLGKLVGGRGGQSLPRLALDLKQSRVKDH